MIALPFETPSFDIVCHSHTLEHIPDPILCLSECYRVLRPGELPAFTILIVIERLTRSRQGLPASYRRCSEEGREDFLVHTEYGSDAWKQVIQSRFQEFRFTVLEYPASLALVTTQ